MLDCPTCGHRAPYCDDCLNDVTLQLQGPAAARGVLWGEHVVARLGVLRAQTKPFPKFDESERVRLLAFEKVRGLAKDPRLVERLARRCVAEAARAYAKKAQGS